MEHRLFLVCFTLFFLSSGVVSDTEVVNGTLGNYFYLNQTFSNPVLLLQWYFNGNLTATRYASLAPECFSSYAGRCQMYEDGTLRLDNLTSPDDGIYRFIIMRAPFTMEKETVYELRVYPVLNAPVLSSNSTSNNLIGGSYVSLHCNASGQNVTTYTFYRDGKNICSEPHVICQNSNFYLQPITGSDSGSYTCTIQNPVSTKTSRNFVQLNVIGVVSEVVNGTLGNYIYLNQSISNPVLLLQWYFEGILIATSYSPLAPECISSYAGRCQIYDDGTLRLDNLTSSDDGIFRFTAVQPPVTIVKEAIYELRVYYVLSAPVLRSNSTSNNLIGGSYVSLHCNASGQNITTYTFYRDGKNICSEPHVICQNSYFYFQPITGSDSGSYTCTIQNPVSTKTSRNSVQLNVIDPVSYVNVTSNVSGLVWPGLDSVSLICSAQGTNVTYFWSLQGAPLPKDPQYHLTENNRVLTINPVSDNGTFACTAANSINSQTSNGVVFNMASQVTAVMVTSNASGLVWVEQESVSLHCSAWGSAINFSWSLNGEILPKDPQYHITQSDSPPQSNLIISPVSKNDAGLFTCTASNKLNNETSSGLTLSLAWPPEGHMACLQGSSSLYIQLSCSWQGGEPAANVTMVFNDLSETGTNQVTRNMPANTSLEELTMMCYGDYFGRPSNCEQKFAPSSCHGLSGGEVAGIVIGVVAGIAIIEVIVFFVLKTKKKPPLGTIYDNSNVPPPHIYSTIIPGTELKPRQQESDYELKPRQQESDYELKPRQQESDYEVLDSV